MRILLGNTANDQAREAELVNTYVAQNVAGLVIAPLDAAISLPVLQRASQSMRIAITNTSTDEAPFIEELYSLCMEGESMKGEAFESLKSE